MLNILEGNAVRPKVLVVEDESIVGRVCQAVLERGQFQVILAPNGKEGLELYSRLPREFILVLADIRMPVMDGIEMTRQMIALNPNCRIVLMTGYDSAGLIPDDLRQFCSTINKPFSASQLIAVVKECVAYEERQGTAAA